MSGIFNPGGQNALLDGANHTDTVAQTVSRGSVIYGNSTPKWDELTVGASGKVLRSDGTDVAWGFPLTLATHSSATLAASVGLLYLCDVSANAIAITFPSSPSANDMFGYLIGTAASNWATGAGPVTGGSAPSIRGSTSHDNKWELFVQGELLLFRYSGSTWLVEQDGRIAHFGTMYRSGTTTGSAFTTGVAYVTCPVNASVGVVGLYADTGNNRFTIRRTGTYLLSGAVRISSLASDKRIIGVVGDNSTTVYNLGGIMFSRAAGLRMTSDFSNKLASLTKGGHVQLKGYHDDASSQEFYDDGTTTSGNCNLTLSEKLS